MGKFPEKKLPTVTSPFRKSPAPVLVVRQFSRSLKSTNIPRSVVAFETADMNQGYDNQWNEKLQ